MFLPNQSSCSRLDIVDTEYLIQQEFKFAEECYFAECLRNFAHLEVENFVFPLISAKVLHGLSKKSQSIAWCE